MSDGEVSEELQKAITDLEDSVQERWNTLSQLRFAQNQSHTLDVSFLQDYRDELEKKLETACKRIWASEALLVSCHGYSQNFGVHARERKLAANTICTYAKSAVLREATSAGTEALRRSEFSADLASLVSEDFVSELRSANIVSVESRDSSGNTALHFAAWRGHLLACHWLCSQGADIQARNDAGRTPLIFAKHGKQSDCEKFLRTWTSPFVGRVEKTPSELSHDETSHDNASTRSGDWDEQSALNSNASLTARSIPASPPDPADLWDFAVAQDVMPGEAHGVLGANCLDSSSDSKMQNGTGNPSTTAVNSSQEHSFTGSEAMQSKVSSNLDAFAAFEGVMLRGAFCDVVDGPTLDSLHSNFDLEQSDCEETSVLDTSEEDPFLDRFQTGTCYHRFLFSDELGLQTPQTSFTDSPERASPLAANRNGTEPPVPDWNLNFGHHPSPEIVPGGQMRVHDVHPLVLTAGQVFAQGTSLPGCRGVNGEAIAQCVHVQDGKVVSQTLLA